MRQYLYSIPILIFLCLLLMTPKFVAGQDGIVWKTVKKNIRNDFPKVKQLGVDSLSAWMDLDKELIILDARKKEEFDISHIKNAVRIDPGIESAPKWLLDSEGKTVVVYCSVGYRSSKIADLLIGEGLKKVYNLEGSIFEWANEGYQLYSNEKRVHKVHPYNSLWGRLLDRQYRSE